MIEFCTLLDLNPLNANSQGDENGEFTFNGDQGQSVVDYALMSNDLFDESIFCFHVNLDRVESDYSPIQFSLLLRSKIERKVLQQKYYTKLTWNPTRYDNFVHEMFSYQTESKLSEALFLLDTDINHAVGIFNRIFTDSTKSMEKRVKTGPSPNQQNNAWFDSVVSVAPALAYFLE